jgi:hypothetical protein
VIHDVDRSQMGGRRPHVDNAVDDGNAQLPDIRQRLGERASSTPKLPFKLGPTNGRDVRESGLRLKASVTYMWRLRSPSSFLNAGVDRYDRGGGEVLAEVNLCARGSRRASMGPDMTDVGEAA